MKLYLVQHARAVAKAENPERPLSVEGLSDMHRVIKLLSKRKHPVSVREIRHSGKRRAQQTAELLLEAVHTEHSLVEDADLVPNADPEIWIYKLLGMTGELMLVGHMPHLLKLGERLLSIFGTQHGKTTELSFVNGGVICLERNELGVWRRKWGVTP